jgi:hypothetical protein
MGMVQNSQSQGMDGEYGLARLSMTTSADPIVPDFIAIAGITV